MPRALIVTYGVGHVQMAMPVLANLRRLGLEVVYLALTSAGPAVRMAGIACVGYSDLMRPEDHQARRWGERLLGASHNEASGIPRDESIAYLGLSYQDLVDRHGDKAAAERYGRYQRHAFFQVGPMRRALEKWRPDAVMVTNSPKSERAMLQAARELEIPSLSVEDLLGLRPRLFPDFVPPPRADRVCCGSVIARDNLIKQGVAAETIRITGNPAFDSIASLDPAGLRRGMRATLGWPAEAPVLLCAPEVSSPNGELAQQLSALLGTIPDLRLLIRRHPSQWHQSTVLADLAGPRCRMVEDQPLYPLLAATDLVLAVSSTLAIEALLIGCSVLQAGPGLAMADWTKAPHEDLPLFRHGAAVLVDSQAALHQAVRDALNPAARIATMDRLRGMFPQPGQSAAFVAEELEALARARGESPHLIGSRGH